jgi:DNA-binding protein HU-beta
MNKAELAAAISNRTTIAKKDAEAMIEAFTAITTDTLKNGGEVVLAGFGAFMAKTRKGRIGVNPRNPTEKITINSVTVPKFKAGINLKKALKEKAPAAPVAAPAAQV